MQIYSNTNLGAIALGSNLGDSYKIVIAALEQLNSHPKIEIVRVSRWYRTKAITVTNAAPQPDYINGCAILSTSLSPQALLTVLLDTEVLFGRERRERWGSRTLDLDLLLFADCIVDTPRLNVPHPRMGDRAFVLLPLAEIAPDWIHPLSGLSITKLATNPPDLAQSCPQLITDLPVLGYR